MKAILEFDLDEFEDKHQHKCAINAGIVQNQIYELDQELRSVFKHGTSVIFSEKFDDIEELIELIRSHLSKECIIEEGL